MRRLLLFKWFVLTLIITSLVIPLKNAEATWQTVLNENFIGDWASWPWATWGNQWNVQPLGGYRWGIAPLYTHYPFEPFQCIWCAGLNGSQISNLDPFVDSYPPNQHTRVIWGPFSLADVAAAECNLWYLNDCQQIQDYLLWGASLDPNANTIYESGRHSGPNPTYQWANAVIDFSDLIDPAGNPVSMIGQANVYLAILFHSNSSYQTTWGGFLDDITLSVDDGLFDLSTNGTRFFFPEDTVETNMLYEWQPYLIGMDWECDGTGETPPFTIECFVDGDLWHSEITTATGGETYTTYFDSLWSGDIGFHDIEWFVDYYDDVEETHEDNNQEMFPFEVVMIDSIPQIEILTPAEGDSADQGFWITWEAYDRESDARIYIHYDTDSVGFNGIQINYGIPIYESDPDSFYWDTSGMPEGSVYVYGKINDFVNAMVYDYSDFPLTIHHPSGVSIPGIQPVEFSLQPNYPNPFNASTTITYTAPEKSRVELSVYDVEGRLVGNLLNGEISPGAHQTVWNANDAASGIYFARIVLQGLNSGETFTAAQKILLVR